MKFYVIRKSTDEVVERFEADDLVAACRYMNKVYGDDDEDIDLFMDEQKGDNNERP